MRFIINPTFTNELPADIVTTNEPRQVFNACYSYVTPRVPSQPRLVSTTPEVLDLLGLSTNDAYSDEFLSVFSGASVIPTTKPYAMCYSGHQFGNWAGQLGDGRAINLTEVEYANKRWALQLKGAGRTPYSRTADGLAVLRSSVREFLCAEAMHHLGVATTRSLSLMLTGDNVLRDVLYNGNAAYEQGAVVCRVAQSFVRFGNFELFAARQDINNLQALTNYTITHFYPHLTVGNKQCYVQFFEAVANATLTMVINWQRVGFVHGVMNTDNMSILGLTIDYGPYGWLEGFDNNWTPNTTDAQHSRYRYGNQINVAGWNLVQLANALYPLIEDTKTLQAILDNYYEQASSNYLTMMRNKLGLQNAMDNDVALISDLEKVLPLTETDFTIFFRTLSTVKKHSVLTHTITDLQPIITAFYSPETLTGNVLDAWCAWLHKYNTRLQSETINDTERQCTMNLVNPKYVLRNYMAQLVIDAAENNDYTLLHEMQTLLKQPYSEQPEYEHWFVKRPEWARHKIGCSMLSCSS